MQWNIKEAMEYYGTQGAPKDQTALIQLLREIQTESGNTIPTDAISLIASEYNIRESYITAIIKRIPSLKINNSHCIEICSGANCSKKDRFSDDVKKMVGESSARIEVKYSGCMKMCRQGPNIKFDGKIYHHADKEMIAGLIKECSKNNG